MAISNEQLAADWKSAAAFWGIAIQAGLPHMDPNAEGIAFIDLKTREVTVNPRRLEKMKVEDCLRAVLSHELGHHLRYPGSLSTLARLELFERDLLPYRAYNLLNLFTDLLINLDLGRDPALRSQISRIFTAAPHSEEMAKADPAFFFYLTCLEEAWALAPRSLTGEAGEALENLYAGCRAEAQLMIQELPNLAPNIFTQYLYFASVVSRFQEPDPSKARSSSVDPMSGDYGRPDAGDYADALERSTRESEAIRRALSEGWLRKKDLADEKTGVERRIAGLPGLCAGEPKKLRDAMAQHYRRLAERYLLKPPPIRRGGEPLIPSTLSPWEVGDSPQEIDWLASVLAGGPALGAAMPLKRDLIDDEPSEEPRPAPRRLEIYLDVSGSMPDPKVSINSMTLAAQVLCLSAIRAGSQVRGLIYSSNHEDHWEWTRSEREISTFLMSYIGGGTQFPFDVLEASVDSCGADQPIRVVLTDADFAMNLQRGGMRAAGTAARRAPFIALLNLAPAEDAAWTRAIKATGMLPIPVRDLEQFPQVAAALAKSLYDDQKGRDG